MAMKESSKYTVVINGLKFTYPGIDGHPPPASTIDDFSLRLNAGDRCLLVGSNGSGKRTILKILGGKHIVEPHMVRVLDRSVFHDTALTSSGDLSYLGEELKPDVASAFVMDVSAEKMIFDLAGLPQRREELIKILDIDRSWRMHKVSEGQRRRVQICMGLLKPFKVLLLDEKAVVGLDMLARVNLQRFLKKECEEHDATIIYATHIFDGLDDWPSHIVYVAHGKLKRVLHMDIFKEKCKLQLWICVEHWLRKERDKESRNGNDFSEFNKQVEGSHVTEDPTCAAPISTKRDEEWINERYRKDGEIGEGSSGVVYQGWDRQERRAVAMKMVEINSKSSHVPDVENGEIPILEKLGEHPNIIRLLDKVTGSPHVYMIFELMDMSFLKFMTSYPRVLDEDTNRKKLLHQMLCAVAYCDSKNIVHRDVKPENLLINTGSLNIKLADFGFSVDLNSEIAIDAVKIGTPGYIAPEVMLRPLQFKISADVWSVGCIFAEILKHEQLFGSGSSEGEEFKKSEKKVVECENSEEEEEEVDENSEEEEEEVDENSEEEVDENSEEEVEEVGESDEELSDSNEEEEEDVSNEEEEEPVVILRKEQWELAQNQLQIIYSFMGIPNEETWPGIVSLHNHHGLSFTDSIPADFSVEFPNLNPAGIDILKRMLCLNPDHRITPQAALEHDYLRVD